jgi:hypothetical protein
MKPLIKIGAGLSVLGLSACVTVPQGPSYPAMPGNGMSYQQFNADDLRCRQFAGGQVGSAADNANNSAAASAVLGTAIGAAAGLAMGGNSQAAGVGAGMGLLAGSAIGSGTAQSSYYATQRQYDAVYAQCMYAAGHKVAVPGRYAWQYQQRSYQPAPPPPSSTNAPPGYEPSTSIPPPNAPPPR